MSLRAHLVSRRGTHVVAVRGAGQDRVAAAQQGELRLRQSHLGLRVLRQQQPRRAIELRGQQTPLFERQTCGNCKLRGRGEPASIGDAEVQAFLRELDVDLVRVLEDVIDLPVAGGVFRFTDLPDSAQQKLMFRKTLRSQGQAVPDPLGAEEGLL